MFIYMNPYFEYNVLKKLVGVSLVCPALCCRSLVKQRIMQRAQLGENIALNMQKLQKEGEQCCSRMWQRIALCVADADQMLICYQKAVITLEVSPFFWLLITVVM